MIDAKIDTSELARSVKSWSRAFGDTNEQALMRLSSETCRQLAMKTQPWGTGKNAREKIAGAIEFDVYKTIISIRDRKTWNEILAGRQFSIRASNKLVRIQGRNKQILRSLSDIGSWIENSRTGGRVVRKMGVLNRALAWHEDVAAVVNSRRKSAGMAKGGWVLAGQDVARKTNKKGLGVGKRYAKWAKDAAVRAGVRGYIEPLKDMWRPKVKISNTARHTKSDYVLKDRDIKNAVLNAFRKVKRYYVVAVNAMDKRKHTR